MSSNATVGEFIPIVALNYRLNSYVSYFSSKSSHFLNTLTIGLGLVLGLIGGSVC